MKWYKQVKRRVIKKYFPHYHDGVLYSFEAWEKFLQKVNQLIVGESKVWVCYNHTWETVKEIEFEQRSIGSKGKAIWGVCIITKNDWCLYDESMFDIDYWK